jgi:hypothetical protein
LEASHIRGGRKGEIPDDVGASKSAILVAELKELIYATPNLGSGLAVKGVSVAEGDNS